MSRNRSSSANRKSHSHAAHKQAVALSSLSAIAATPDASQAVAAVKALSALAPTLHEHPDLMQEVRHVLTLATARGEAVANGNAYTGVGTPAPHPALLLGNSFSPDILRQSPTQSEPRASTPAGQFGGWAGSKDQPKGVLNARLLRNFSNDPWVFAAIKHRKERVARADIDIVPLDPDRAYDKLVQKQLKRLLSCPNEYRDSYTSLMKRVIDDILVLDRGAISKSMTPRRIPTGLYSEDGSTIKIYANWDGNPKTPRYLYEEPGSTHKVALRNDELICIMESEATYRFGYSRVQALLDDIEADIQASQSAKNLVTNKPPPHLIHVPGASEENIKALRAAYEATVAGKRETFFMGSPDANSVAQVKPMIFSLRDNQWMEWMTYLARKICAVFQVSPQSIGITFDVNRATSESQQDIEDDAGNIPLLLLIEEYLNRELVWDFCALAKDGRPDFETLNLAAIFPEVSEASRILHVERLVSLAEKGLAKAPFMTPNMVLEMLGEKPLKGGNTIYYPSPANGMMPWLSYDGELGDYAAFGSTSGELGAQTPAGGPDEDEAETDDAESKGKQDKPPAASGNAVGDETSGNGSQPPMGSVDEGGAGSSSGGGASKSLVRRDTRQPGQRWAPHMRRGARDIVTDYPAPGVRVPQPTVSKMTTVDEARIAQLVSAAVEQALAKAAEERLHRVPRSLGRVSAEVAAAHTRPHEHVEAQAQLTAAAHTLFEGADKRGRETLASKD